MTPLIVPDASVLLKWVLRTSGEADQERALDLQRAWLSGACDIVVPTLWIFEVGNVLGLKQPAEAETLLGAMIDLRLPEVPPAEYLSEIVGLMRRYKVTCYDAAYHGLALARQGTMLTADRRYVTKAGAAGGVRLLDGKPVD